MGTEQVRTENGGEIQLHSAVVASNCGMRWELINYTKF